MPRGSNGSAERRIQGVDCGGGGCRDALPRHMDAPSDPGNGAGDGGTGGNLVLLENMSQGFLEYREISILK